MTMEYKDMRVLVADDMSNMRRTIKNMLRTIGFGNIVEAADGQKAWEKLKQEQIHFVVTDWNMPNVTGFELLKRIREDQDLQNTPVLLITAEMTEAQVAHAAEIMVDGYIVKPFELTTLQRKIESVLEKRSKPSYLDTQINVGKALLSGQMFDQAIAEYQKALSKYPKSARLLTAMAEGYEKKGDSEKAEVAYRRANEINPLFIKALVGLGDLYEKDGNMLGAAEIMEKAAKISPNDPHRQKKIGEIHLKQGNTAKAQAAFNMAIKNSGDDPTISTEIGEAYLEADMPDQAANSFKKSLAVNPNDIHVYNRLGIALRKKGRFTEAITEYHKAIAVAPDDEVLYYNIAKAYHEAKKNNDAIKMLEKALKLDPEFQEAINFRREIASGGF